MSIKQFPGGIITKNPTAPTTSTAQGIWTLDQAQNYTKQGIWPRSPGAPTIGTATDAATGGKVNVTFTAPSCTGSNAITGYTAVSTPSCITGTGASSPIQVSGLSNGTSYTFQVRATNGAGTGPLSAASNSVTPTAPVTGQQAYTSAGSYTWVAPTGVTKVSVVAVGGGSGGSGSYPGSGGGLGYKNNYTVTPGSSYTVVVGSGGSYNGSGGTNSYFVSTCVVKGGGGPSCYPGTVSGGTYTGDGGGNGGRTRCSGGSGGGGAGGYAGTGGRGAAGSLSTAGCSGAGGGGGGGAQYGMSPPAGGRGGGGVGILGQGSNGSGNYGAGGGGGSGGSAGGNGSGYIICCVPTLFAGNGGAYGGGAGGYNGTGGVGAGGAVRIIWPGNTRSFPSTCTGNL